MIQDIFPHQFKNNYNAKSKITKDDYVFHYQANTILLKTNGKGFEFPSLKDFPNLHVNTKFTFLFTLNDIPCFLLLDDPNINAPNFIYKEISSFRIIVQKEIAWTIIAGFHLLNWYLQNQFCGKCGAKTQHKHDERAILCPDCNNVVYPKISPAIIVAITCGKKILLVRGNNFPGSWYSLIAGYADIGETLEETVIREVKEEVGLDVVNIRYYKSQPWPLSGSLMVGFIAEANDNQEIKVDTNELKEAAWFSRGNLPGYSPDLGIAGEMIKKFDKGEL